MRIRREVVNESSSGVEKVIKKERNKEVKWRKGEKVEERNGKGENEDNK